jgi:RNA polymerase sigma factor (sigma-70 family)
MEPLTVLDDLSLLSKIVQRDQSALSALYDRYARVLYAMAYKSLRSTEESEEIVLDVFSQVWRIADRYDPTKARVDSWLFMLTRSRVLDRLRKLQRAAAPPMFVDLVENQSQSVSVDPVEAAVVLERRDRVLTMLKALPDEQRRVIELAYYQGLTHVQIAEQTGMSLGTVKTRIRLGLSKLRKIWDSSEQNPFGD